MGNRRVLPPALKDTCVYVPAKKEQHRSSGCDDTVVLRCFRRMLRHYPFRIYREERAWAQPRENRRYARTHTRASTAGRATRNTGSTGIKAPSLEAGGGATRRGVAHPIRAGSHGHVHASAGTRAESPSRSSPGSRWALMWPPIRCLRHPEYLYIRPMLHFFFLSLSLCFFLHIVRSSSTVIISLSLSLWGRVLFSILSYVCNIDFILQFISLFFHTG